MGRVLKLVFVAAFVAVAVGAARSTYDLVRSSGNGSVAATRSVRSTISAVVAAEAAARDATLDQTDAASATYRGSLGHVDDARAELRRRVGDDAAVRTRLRHFERAIDEWHAQVVLATDAVPSGTAGTRSRAGAASGTTRAPVGPGTTDGTGTPATPVAPGTPGAVGPPGAQGSRRDPMINDIRTTGDNLVNAIEDAANEERTHAAIRGLVLLGGFCAAFVVLNWLLLERSKRRGARARADQIAFSERLQTARSEEQAQAMLAEELESLVPGANVVVTSDRDGPVDGRPIVARGERIGTVVVRSRRDLTRAAEDAVRDAILRAAPVIGSLRTLAVAQVTASTDPLTGLGNRRLVQDELAKIAAHATRTGDPFAVVMIDLDRFKPVNDSYGHAAGDALLVAIAQVLRGETRGYDVLGRRGGDEFIAVLPGVDAAGAAHVMERCRSGIAALRIGRPPVTATASIGVTNGGSGRSTDPDQLVREADAAVYAAKALGGNCVVTSTAVAQHSVRS